MRYKVVLNGCSPGFSSQCRAVNAFLADTAALDTEAQTIVFYNNPALMQPLIKETPTTLLHLVKIAEYEAETVLLLLAELESSNPAELYLFPGDYAGSELAVRFAGRLGGSSLVGVENLRLESDHIICAKPVYNGHLQGTFKLRKRPFCLSLARSISGRGNNQASEKRNVNKSDCTDEPLPAHLMERLVETAESLGELEEARFVVAGGRGINSKVNYMKLQQIASYLGAALGVSRPVAMNGWAPLAKLIGVSGAIISPEVCLALAVSGSPAFFSGIERSKHIIALNIDPQAAIVKNADLAVIDDYKAILTELTRLIEKDKTVKWSG